LIEHPSLIKHPAAPHVRNTQVTNWGKVAKYEPRWQSGVLTTAALGLAAEKFSDKARKGGDTPYLSHLLAVSALIMEHGGTEEQAAAGLLHDIIEDIGVSTGELVDLLVERGADRGAGERVATMVEGTTDGQASDKRNKADWSERKRTYIERLTTKPVTDPALLVSLADKVHNAEATLAQVRSGQSANDIYASAEFNAKASEQKWYYTTLAGVFSAKLKGDVGAQPLVHRLVAAVDEIFIDVTEIGAPR